MPPVYNWTGFYAGINGGFGGGVAKPTDLLSAAPDIVLHYTGVYITDAQVHRLGGGFAGAQAGYNYQLRNDVVLGIESDLQWSDIRASDSRNIAVSIGATGPFPINSFTSATITVRQNWFGTTRLRLGYQAADRLLAYVTGGVAYSGFTASNSGYAAQQTPQPAPISNTSGAMTSTRIGWAAGAGLEYALGNNFSIKSEYLFSEYGGVVAPHLINQTFIPTLSSGAFSTGSLGIHLVRAGLNYKLGEPVDARAAAGLTAPAPLFNWTGFYAGVNEGFGGGVANPMLSEVSVQSFAGIPSPPDTSTTSETLRMGGFTFGGQLGYNRQLSERVLAGMETDFQWSNIRASRHSNLLGASITPSAPVQFANSATSVTQDWFGTTRMRLGYLVSNRLLAYAAGGVAYSGIVADNSGTSGDYAFQSSVTTIGPRRSAKIGWTVGAGVEYAMAGNLSLKTEYLYSEYAGASVPYQTAATAQFFSTATQGTLTTGTLGIHLVRAGLNWKLSESGH